MRKLRAHMSSRRPMGEMAAAAGMARWLISMSMISISRVSRLTALKGNETRRSYSSRIIRCSLRILRRAMKQE